MWNPFKKKTPKDGPRYCHLCGRELHYHEVATEYSTRTGLPIQKECFISCPGFRLVFTEDAVFDNGHFIRHWTTKMNPETGYCVVDDGEGNPHLDYFI